MKKCYVQLPNGRVTYVNEIGFVSVTCNIDLSVFIDNDLEGVLDTLSEEATGSSCLTNVSYKVTGHEGNTLKILISGDIEAIEATPVDLDKIAPMEFEATVSRIGYGSRTFRLSARSEIEAELIADDDAGNHVYNEHSSVYEIDVRRV